MALYHCRMQASKHATGTRLPVHWTLKCYAKNPSKESLRPLVETCTEYKPEDPSAAYIAII